MEQVENIFSIADNEEVFLAFASADDFLSLKGT